MQPTPRLRRFVLASAATVALGLGLVTVSAVGVVSTPGVEASTSATLYAGTLYSALAPAQSQTAGARSRVCTLVTQWAL